MVYMHINYLPILEDYVQEKGRYPLLEKKGRSKWNLTTKEIGGMDSIPPP